MPPFCTNCGNDLAGGPFCGKCGTPAGGAAQPTAMAMATPVPQVDKEAEIRAQAERQDRLAMIAMTQSRAAAAPVCNNNNNNNIVVNVAGGGAAAASYYQDPGCCMKCCCPPCAVFSTYGYPKCPECLLALCLCECYTLCCWAPSTQKRPGGAPETEEITDR